MKVDILLPTCKPFAEVAPIIDQIRSTRNMQGEIIATCQNKSAAVNRNIAMNQATSDYIIMVDDDITGYYPDWDLDLLWGFAELPDALILSARLLKPEGKLAPTMAGNYNINDLVVRVERVPTACIAFRNTPIRFDETFIGSGWEDNDFCRQLLQAHPDKRIYINNKCRLIHLNEAKNQGGFTWEANKEYYFAKWKTLI